MIKTIKALRKYSKPYRALIILAAVLTVIFAMLAQVDPYFTGVVIDALLENKDRSIVIKSILIIIGVTLLRTGIRYIYVMSFEQVSQKVIYGLRQDLYRKLQELDFDYFDKTPTGKLMSKMTGDIEAIRHFYAWTIHVSIFHVSIFIVAMVLMVTINPLLALSLVFTLPIIGYVSMKLSKSVKPTFVAIREQFSKLNSVVQENISGNRLVKAFGREDYEIEKFEKENQGYKDKNLASAKVWEKYVPIIDGLAVLFNVNVVLIGGILVINNKMTIGELVTFNRLMWMINNPLRMMGWIVNGTQNFVASYEKVKEVLDEEIKIKSHEKALIDININGNVEFKNVSFQYENLPIIKNVSFKAYAGQTVAVMGATGSGKSTLASLISRFYDVTEGDLLIDGRSVKDYELTNLRSHISVAMQDIFLFSDTITGNISYGVPEANNNEINWVSKITGINEFVQRLDDGFNTIIGERGVGLSGGQKQRIALARALIQNPTILILDDTTSAVDMETEYEILKELKKINSNRTTFVIAHRISSVKDADMILVMDQGEIVERGTHHELLELKGHYYQVYSQQMGEFNKDEMEVLV